MFQHSILRTLPSSAPASEVDAAVLVEEAATSSAAELELEVSSAAEEDAAAVLADAALLAAELAELAVDDPQAAIGATIAATTARLISVDIRFFIIHFLPLKM